ncbi:hypothetical protein GIB67_041771 [Kingdonia uniflora]|uniref:Aminotransferase-like plant mobile domain-containing protein n=1 Tax=Kingdonia uniflora TaxID=39325 RepID=A0A7J7NCM9_9MAGN|nr:hypothetical protein GIB67_041771 [Kingdonia uniflora]
MVQELVKLKGLDRIGAISYDCYNCGLISAFAKRWQPKTNSFHFKWGEMTPTLDDVEQLIGFGADGDATVIGDIWGFSVLLEVFQKNLLLDFNGFKILKVGSVGNSLLLRKLIEHCAYKLEKVISDGTAEAAKKTGLTARFVARACMLYVLDSFLFPTKKGTDVNARYFDLFAKDKATKKWSWGSTVLVHMYHNLDIGVQEFTRKNASLEVELRQKYCLEDCNESLSIELNKMSKENESLKAVNALLMEHIELQLSPATPILNWISKYKKEASRYTEETKDLGKKLVNVEEMKNTLEVDNNEWEVWRQSLKKTLASEGMGYMGDPTFEELF